MHLSINCTVAPGQGTPGRWWGFDQSGGKCILNPHPGTDEMVKQPHPRPRWGRECAARYVCPTWTIESSQGLTLNTKITDGADCS